MEVPDTQCPLNDNNLTALKQSIDVTIDDGNYGITLFMNCLAQVSQLFQSEQTN